MTTTHVIKFIYGIVTLELFLFQMWCITRLPVWFPPNQMPDDSIPLSSVFDYLVTLPAVIIGCVAAVAAFSGIMMAPHYYLDYFKEQLIINYGGKVLYKRKKLKVKL
jgi:hypothetical protein